MTDRPTRDSFGYLLPISTRWMDNDAYGHVNNVTYYSYFDTVANHYLINEGGLDIQTSPIIGYVVNSQCNYFSAVAYPDELEAGLRVNRLGNSSVEYGIAIFRQTDELAAAYGTFTHVFVDRKTEQSTPIPETIRQALEKLS